MARWYSKQRKQRMTGDFHAHGFIPARGRMNLEQKAARYGYGFRGLELCDYGGECDCCNHPKSTDKVWASMYYPPEDNPECDHVICQRCLVRRFHSRFINDEWGNQQYSNFIRWKRVQALKPGQHICDYCDEVATGDCNCNGATYWREQAAVA